MLGPFGYSLWALSFLLEIYVVVYFCIHRQFLRHFALGIYMSALALKEIYLFHAFRTYGFSSMEYRYIYYYSDALMTLLLFFVIMEFYQKVFHELRVSRYLRGATILLLTGAALFSYIFVQRNVDHLTSRFVVELGQNLYFVGLVLTYCLWGALLKLREARLRLIQLILALGISFSATAATFALRNLFPSLQDEILRFVPPVIGTWLPLAWAYTFTKIPEDARLATARLLARAR